MTHGDNGHETASYMVQTGRQPRRPGGLPQRRGGGLAVQGQRREQAGLLIPPYIVLTQPQGRFSEAGFLGSRYKPFATGGDPTQPRFVVEGVVGQGTDEQQRQRRDLLAPPRHARPGAVEEQPTLQALAQVRERGLRPDPRRRRQGVRSDPGEGRAAQNATAATPSASRA